MSPEREPQDAAWKWAALGATVITLEVIGSETLTSGFKRFLQHDVGKYIGPIAIGLTAGHLLGILPEKIDPYAQIANLVDRITDGTPEA